MTTATVRVLTDVVGVLGFVVKVWLVTALAAIAFAVLSAPFWVALYWIWS